MNKLNLHSVARKRKVVQRAKAEIYHSSDNRLRQEFLASQPNQKWVTDVTYIATQTGWAYLSTIQDLFDGFILSPQLARVNSLELVLNTLKQAKQREQFTPGLVLHSDRGYHDTSHSYAALLQD